MQRAANPKAADADGATPLHAAAAADCPEVVELLLAYGADISAKDKAGATALHAAARSGCTAVRTHQPLPST